MATAVTTNSSNMKAISVWSDAIPFAGKIVAYKTDSVFFGATKGYVFSRDTELRYGYVNHFTNKWSTEEKGYLLVRLIKSSENPGVCGMVNSTLNPPIYMRKATEEEVDFIRKAVAGGHAKFDNPDLRRLNARLKSRISKL